MSYGMPQISQIRDLLIEHYDDIADEVGDFYETMYDSKGVLIQTEDDGEVLVTLTWKGADARLHLGKPVYDDEVEAAFERQIHEDSSLHRPSNHP